MLYNRLSRRPRLVCLIISFLFLWIFRRNIHAAFLLAAEPLIFTYGDHSFVVSRARDDFDITFSAYPSLPANSTSSALTSASTSLVPPIIHSILLGPSPMRPNWLAANDACKTQHPSYEFMFWNDSAAEAFVLHHYPDVYGMWSSYSQVIQRADALRYMLLHHYGGIYIDLDLHCRRPLDPLRQFSFVAPAAFPAGVSNGFIMSAPNTTFMHSVIANLPKFDLSWFGLPYLGVSFSTGCHYLSTIHAWSPASERQGLRVLAGGEGGGRLHQLNGNVSTPLFYHWGSSSWHSYDAEIFKMVRTGTWRTALNQKVGTVWGALITMVVGGLVTMVVLVVFAALVVVVARTLRCRWQTAQTQRPKGSRLWSGPHSKSELKV